ncbi:TPA: hypothetical protein ACQUHP_005641 [Bacillus cereus]
MYNVELKKKRIRILDLQDQHCRICKHQMQPLKECILHCEIGNELKRLAKALFPESSERKSTEEWNAICRQAIKLYEQGLGTTRVSKELGCASSTLREQLKKRKMWRGQTQDEIQEQSRKKWDDWCDRAKQLREKGWSYPKIEKHLKIPASNLRKEMRKREFERK